MPKRWPVVAGICFFALLSFSCVSEQREPENQDIWFFVLVKSSNYAQSDTGALTLLNYHFFSEIFPKAGKAASITGHLIRHDSPDSPMPYVARQSSYYVEGGHFDSIGDLDAAFPNGRFRFEIASHDLQINTDLQLSGPGGETDIPDPIRISLSQKGVSVGPLDIDSSETLLVRWSGYSNGAAGPNGILDDMIFVVVQDCVGNRIVHTGLPFKDIDYLTYRAKELVIAPGTMSPGEPYAMFVEFPHVVDSVIVNGAPGFTSFATATYLDIKTKGESSRATCDDDMPPMDTGQTDR